ncbi:hypothetical protein HEP81_08222 (plasmid) [Streptomyces griseofuscus]|uniref:Uncharacterized protein n=1 Tax=Streptomyces griseofuscus TaxID=146922 RepID=A0A7H1QDR8_9ACTN|nr:hypothetical protein [Streptomyces griseofuscus]QNT98448.1 hypothetical protein HEP81_08222 [Streptomyces griseofuscus]
MTDAVNATPATRASRVISIVAVVIGVAYTGLWAFISIPQLMDYIGDRDITAPLFLAIAVLAGPALFWSFIGLGIGISALGWAAGLASTGILVSLTYGSLLASSDGHGFAYWLFLTLIVACNVAAFCVAPYALGRGTIGRRR